MSDRTTANSQALWRLTRRLDQKIAALLAAEPGLRARVRRRARQQALQSLGLAALQAERDALVAQQRELARRRQHVERALLATVRRVSLADVPDRPGGLAGAEVRRALRRRQAVHERELLAEDERGREILRLRREQGHLCDALWLAAAPPPVQALWRQVLALAGEEPTALEQAALAFAGNGSA